MPLSLPSWASLLSAHAPEGETYLLRRRRSRAIDASYGDRRLAEIRAAATAASGAAGAADGVGAGAWPGIRAVLAAAEDDEDLAFLVRGLQSVPDVERWIGDAVAADPDDPLPLLVSGARLLARSGYAGVRRPPQVTGQQAEIARVRLENAEEQLFEVAEREPDWAAPWYFLMASAGAGTRSGAAAGARETAARRFAAVVRRVPGHAAAHRLRLAQLSPAWPGAGAVASTDASADTWAGATATEPEQAPDAPVDVSTDMSAADAAGATEPEQAPDAPADVSTDMSAADAAGTSGTADRTHAGDPYRTMHAFARRAMLDAPEGSRLGELVALAHLEQWRDLGADPDSPYLTGEAVVAALREAAVRSVLHPTFERRADWALAANAFAMAFALAGDHVPARTLFTLLGPHRATESPWHLLDERSPLVAFRAWRARVGA
ncbi:hypothetical protein VSR01_06305 [Actinacidiphila sp. DG2A-62]|uniref:hypothetical protein n=1 Tax=Actinacidiphila sp. DG2A-62 TaxID=3108821 RepID=UPI002DBBF69D|nr:hypothetical protein [Actinacidiphila sp. DG2A-62]MEC3993175.1 hypothetical protein [Actinacidiphila sp. DG2A-62]